MFTVYRNSLKNNFNNNGQASNEKNMTINSNGFGDQN